MLLNLGAESMPVLGEWNFRHTVPFEKMGRSEGVNKLPGYMSPSLDSSPGSRDAVKPKRRSTVSQ